MESRDDHIPKPGDAANQRRLAARSITGRINGDEFA